MWIYHDQPLGKKKSHITAKQHASHPSSREPQQNSRALGSHARSSSICHPQSSTGKDDLKVGGKEAAEKVFLPSASFKHIENEVDSDQVYCWSILQPHNTPLLLVFLLGWDLPVPLMFGRTWTQIPWSELAMCFHLAPPAFFVMALPISVPCLSRLHRWRVPLCSLRGQTLAPPTVGTSPGCTMKVRYPLTAGWAPASATTSETHKQMGTKGQRVASVSLCCTDQNQLSFRKGILSK